MDTYKTPQASGQRINRWWSKQPESGGVTKFTIAGYLKDGQIACTTVRATDRRQAARLLQNARKKIRKVLG